VIELWRAASIEQRLIIRRNHLVSSFFLFFRELLVDGLGVINDGSGLTNNASRWSDVSSVCQQVIVAHMRLLSRATECSVTGVPAGVSLADDFCFFDDSGESG
jgi:hypothetical protein